MHGLLGLGSAAGSGSGRGSGLDHRIESGRRIAGYRVVRELGRGGMGTVYEAVHMGLDRPVALKVLGVHAAPDSSARRRFLNEARTAAGLHHTHIVPVFDVGQVGGLCYYAMQRIEGSGLDRVVRHLRRTRQLGAGGGAEPDQPGRVSTSRCQSASGRRRSTPDSAGFGSECPRDGSGGSPAQRLGSWRRVAAERTRLRSVVSPARRSIGSSRYTGLGDSTASWDTSSRRAAEPSIGDDCGASGAIVPASLATLAAADRASRRRDDEPAPFDPPRGSAYFRWVARSVSSRPMPWRTPTTKE